MNKLIPMIASALLMLAGTPYANEPPIVAHTVSGAPLTPTELPEASRARLEGNLARARAEFERDPSELATIWLGRRLAYLQRYPEALAVYDDGLARYPDSYRLLRHKGHRHISRREFDLAINAFLRAWALMPKNVTETEPDGIPNALNEPLSNTQFNVLYHLALAYYLKGDYAAAAGVWSECLDYSPNPDLLVATTDWLWMTLMRLGRSDDAKVLLDAIRPDLEVIENASYLRRLRMYRGELAPEDLMASDAEDPAERALALATQGYGVANWYLLNGAPGKAAAIWAEIRATGSWSAFGYIAAEVDAARAEGAGR